MPLDLRPVTLREACAFIGDLHRHHLPPQGGKFAIGVADQAGALRGVCIVARPVARGFDDGRTAEVVRLCTDGAANACSMLYGAARRAARAMGYRRVITYTLPEEGGASLRASGWRQVATTDGGSWDTPARRRTDRHPTGPKLRWEAPT